MPICYQFPLAVHPPTFSSCLLVICPFIQSLFQSTHYLFIVFTSGRITPNPFFHSIFLLTAPSSIHPGLLSFSLSFYPVHSIYYPATQPTHYPSYPFIILPSQPPYLCISYSTRLLSPHWSILLFQPGWYSSIHPALPSSHSSIHLPLLVSSTLHFFILYSLVARSLSLHQTSSTCSLLSS